MTATQPATPELDKIKAISDRSQAIGEFLDYCQEQGWFLARYPLVRELHPEKYTEEALRQPLRSNEQRRENLDEVSRCAYPLGRGTVTLLAEFFDIDQVKAESERQAVLEYVRAMQEVNQE